MNPLLLIVLCWLLPLASGDEKEELARARKLLAGNKEEDCKEGTDLCVSLDDAAAVELLLEVLRLESDRGLPAAHYRDVVWGGLRRMSSEPARARVVQELEKDKKSPLVRQWCAELLGEYGVPDLAEPLGEALDDKDLGVRRAAARALGKLRFPEGEAHARKTLAMAGLAPLVTDKDPILRANALESLARLDPGEWGDDLGRGLADKDAGVRCALLAATTLLDPEEREALAGAALADPDWRPRLQAVDVLSGIARPSALGKLVGALADARPIVVARAVGHLQELSGEKHTRREAWEAWWKEKGAEFDFSRGRRKEARTQDSTVAGSFNGIVFESDHTAFLIDTSATMAETLKSQDSTKAEAARKELEATLTRLQGKMKFSLFTYAEEVTPFSKKGPVELTAKSQEKALDFVREQRLDGRKNVFQALESVLADPTIDTVFLLSSAEPETGRYVHWNRVTWQLAELNRFRRLTIHAVAYCREEGFRVQIQKIAEVTGGEFVAFE